MPARRAEALRYLDGVLIHDPFGDEFVREECCQGGSCYTEQGGAARREEDDGHPTADRRNADRHRGAEH